MGVRDGLVVEDALDDAVVSAVPARKYRAEVSRPA